MSDEVLFDKQYEFLYAIDKRLNFLVGSVRSGKTYVSLLKFALVVGESNLNDEFLMCAKTLTTLKRNCLNMMVMLVGSRNFQYSLSRKEATLFGRKVYLEGAADETAEQKIRGMTLAGAYCDEITLYPESFVTMLLSRLSVEHAKLYATCNPDNPNHYIKTKYIDNKRDLDIAVWKFLLTDNVFVSKEYVKNISKEYTGVFYTRYIMGEWARAEGVIYDKFCDNTESYIVKDDFDYSSLVKINIGVDFGGSVSATTFVCVGFTRYFKSVIVLEAEYLKDLSPDELEDKYAEFVEKCTKLYGKHMETYVDSAEQILKRGLITKAAVKRLNTEIYNAKKMAVIERIKLVQKLMGQGRFFVRRNCQTVIKAFQEAVWNEKKEDERLDNGTSDIDTLDATEYAIEPSYRELSEYVMV